MIFKRTLFLFLTFLFVLSGFCACALWTPKTRSESVYEYFDTVTSIISYRGDTKKEFKANCNAVKTELKEYHQLLDIYREYEGISNLKTVNDNAGISPVKVDGRLIDFLLYCKELYALTYGETNVAMGAVLKIWHNAREAAEDDPEGAYLPSAEELSEAAKHTDIDSIVIDKDAGTVYISDAHASIDVGAIGKGYAAEKAAQLLISRGVTSYVLNVGGNLRAIGTKANGDGWVTGITNPDKGSDIGFISKVIITDISLVTSGDYERYYTVGEKKYHHIIDKDTNMPSAHFSSVSVLTKDSGLADALSTALFCMSYDEGVSLLRSLGNVDAIWVFPDGTVRMTEGICAVGD